MSEKNAPGGGRLMIIDDEPNVARVLSTFFTREGWRVESHNVPSEALDAMAESDVDVVVSDLRMPEMTGIELLSAMRERGFRAPLLLITAYGTIDSAVAAMKLGAFDYLCKPFEFDKVKDAVQRAYLHRQLQTANEHVEQVLPERTQFGELFGGSRKMLEVYALIERAARSRANVLILGESGTGKELVAKALHTNSARANRRFVPISCAALPNELLESELFGHEKGAFTGANWQRIGRFELADGGTLFLDEIGDISLNVQVKLLRVIQEREIDRVGGSKPVKVDVRLVTATNRNLQEAIVKGDFREDLYYRLRVIEIHLPPLRDRAGDIPLLAKHFVQKYAKREGRKMEGLTPEALELLEAYHWPGNVRELENAVERAVVLADEDATSVTAAILPDHLRQGRDVGRDSPPAPDPNGAQQSLSRKAIEEALDSTHWDLSRAAEQLGVPFQTLCATVRAHNISGHRREGDGG